MEQMRKIVKRCFRESIEAKQRCLDENAEALIKAATMIAEAGFRRSRGEDTRIGTGVLGHDRDPRPP